MDYTADERTAARVIASLIYPDYPKGPDLETHVNGLYGPAVNSCRDPYEMAAITMPLDGILRDCHGDAATAWEGLRQMNGAATPYAKLDPLIRSIGGSLQTDKPILVAGEIVAPARALVAPRYVFHDLKALRAMPPIQWLIDGEIPASLTTIVCGPSGAGKSFLMVDYAIRVARANPERAVIYIAPEGGGGYHMRSDAWVAHFGGDDPPNLVFFLQALPILNPQAIHEFITAAHPIQPVMIVIDTLARCIVGGDENSAKDISMFFYHTDIIRQETNASIVIVHHTGKNGNFRGSSALYGSVESWIDVANDDGLITVSCGKSKDAKPFPPRYLRMVESVESVVLVPADQVTQRSSDLTEGQRKVLETLALDIFTGAGAKRSELVSATGIPEPTMYKILSRLKRNGHISQGKRGDPYFITDEGMAAIKSYHRDLRHNREKLSNYPETINELSDSIPTNYQTISPSIRGEIDSKEDSYRSDDSELFPDREPVPVIAPPTSRAASGALALDWPFLKNAYTAGDHAAIKIHCRMRKVDTDTVLNKLESEQV